MSEMSFSRLVTFAFVVAATSMADELDLSGILGDEPEATPSKFVVHEWGSVNLIQDSDRAIISGLVDDQSDLPPFVHVWTENKQSRFPMVIEKPILYFYSDEAVFANVKVGCPEGILTQWWPQATRVTPAIPSRPDQKMPELKNGVLEWNFVAVAPNVAEPELKKVPKNSWWPVARDTDSAIVRVKGGEEKFLFYRGASRMQSALGVQVNADGAFELRPVVADKPVRHVFTMHVPVKGEPKLGYVEDVKAPGATSKPLASAEEAAAILRKILLAEGLYEKEADGMSKIWKEGMFEAPGLRAMYLMAEEDLNAFLPVTIQPSPDEFKRVMLVRMECLTPEREHEILGLIKQLGADNFRDRGAAQKALMQMGRIGQAMMRRYHAASDDPEIRMRLKTILKQISPQRPR